MTRSSSAAERARPDAGRVFLGLQGGWAFCWSLAFTLSMVFQVSQAHLSPFQLVLVGTVLEVACLLGEIPTGVVADLYSRRLSVIIGLVLLGAGLIVMGAFPSFWPILAGQVVWGVGCTFVSGAQEAWLADEVGEQRLQGLLTRGHQLGLVAGVLGTLAAGAVGLAGLGLPLVAGGAGFVVLALWLVAVMPETGFSPATREGTPLASAADAVRTALTTVRSRPRLRGFVLIAALTGLTSEVFDRLWTARIVTDFTLPPLGTANDLSLWFTAFGLIGSLVGLGASLLANRVAASALSADHPSRVMALLVAVEVLGVAGFALVGHVGAALAFVWLKEAALSVATPVRSAWLNRGLEPATRATALSVMAQADALGQVVGGPALGGVAGRFGVPVGLVTAAIVQSPAALVYARLRPDPGGSVSRSGGR